MSTGGYYIPLFASFYAGLALGQECLTVVQKKKRIGTRESTVKTLIMEETEMGLITPANLADECLEWQIPRL